MSDQAQVVMLLPPCPTPMPGRFVRVTPDTVTVRLFDEPPDIGSDTVGCVQYTWGRREVAFLANVLGLERGPDGHWVTVQRPREVARLEQRRAFRIPVGQRDVGAALSFGPHVLSGWVVDLSQFGAQMAFDPTEVAVVVGQRIVLAMSPNPPVRGDEVVVQGRIVRRTPTGGGMSFVPGPDGQPTPAVLGLVGEVERVWRERRGET